MLNRQSQDCRLIYDKREILVNRTAILFTGFALAALLLFGVIFRLGVLAALPKSEWTDIGLMADFPPSDQPREVFIPVHVFVINDGEQILVLEPMNPVYGGMNVRWSDIEGGFVDPLRGSWFDVYGRPSRKPGINSILEEQNLERYPVKIENDHLWIDLSQTVFETVVPKGKQ